MFSLEAQRRIRGIQTGRCKLSVAVGSLLVVCNFDARPDPVELYRWCIYVYIYSIYIYIYVWYHWIVMVWSRCIVHHPHQLLLWRNLLAWSHYPFVFVGIATRRVGKNSHWLIKNKQPNFSLYYSFVLHAQQDNAMHYLMTAAMRHIFGYLHLGLAPHFLLLY